MTSRHLAVILGLAGIILCLTVPTKGDPVTVNQTVRILAGDTGVRALQREFGESHADPVQETTLPIINIHLKSTQLNKLNSDLPASGKNDKNARVDLEGTTFHAKVRYRGDFFDHWGGTQKSWRVVLRRGERWQGMRRFNLINEKFESTNLSHLAAYEIARRLHLPAPRAFPVHLRINDQFVGQYNCYEHFDESTMPRLHLPVGDILKGDWDNSAGVAPLNIFRRIEPWFKIVNEEGRAKDDFRQTVRLQHLGRSPRPATLEEVSKILDVDNFIRHHILSLYIRFRNNDLLHNHLHYRHPQTNRLHNICWDVYFGNASAIDPDAIWTPIQLMMFADPRLVARRNDLLYALLQNELNPATFLPAVDNIYSQIRLDYGRDPYKGDYWGSEARITPVTGAHMDRDRDKIRTIAQESHHTLTKWVKEGSRLNATLREGWLSLVVSGPVRSVVTGIKWADGPQLEGLPPFPWTLTAQREARHLIDPGIGRYRDGRWQLTPTIYAFDVPKGVRQVTVHWMNPVTGETFTTVPTEFDPLTKLAAKGNLMAQQDLFAKTPQDTQVIGPGTVTITSTTTITANNVEISPGTIITMNPGTSLIINGSLSAPGTQEQPVIIRGEKWGSLILKGPANTLSHCYFENGGDVRLNGVLHMGMVSAYGSPVTLTDCVFTGARGDDGLNVKEAPARLLRCSFVNNAFDGCDLDFSLADVRSCLFIDNGNDGLDLGTATASIVDCEFTGNGDKGLSLGERSHSLISNCLFRGNNMGIAVKDLSRPVIVSCHFVDNQIGINAYRKKSEFGGSHATIAHCSFETNQRLSRKDGVSTLVHHDIIKGATGSVLNGRTSRYLPLAAAPHTGRLK